MKNIRRLTYAAMFAALIFIATAFLQFSIGKGYVHLGDCLVLLSGFCLGPWGVVAAGIGSAMADLFLGYTIYAPVTLVVKALMALVAFLLLRHKKQVFLPAVVGAVFAETLMIAGYFLLEWPLYGLPTAVVDITFNAMQAVVGAVTGVIVLLVLEKTGIREKLFGGEKQ